MIIFDRYPHVRDLVIHYATASKSDRILAIMGMGVDTSEQAFLLSKFIWDMIDEMAKDSELDVMVLGRADNLDMIPDVDYEIGVYLNEQGFGAVWDNVCDEK